MEQNQKQEKEKEKGEEGKDETVRKEEKKEEKEVKEEKEEENEREEERIKRKKEEEDYRKKKEEEDNKEKKNFEKFRIDYLSFKTSQPDTQLTTICPICLNVPNIKCSLNSETGHSHYVKCKTCRYCYCCSHPRSKTLEAYINIMAKLHQDNLKCDIHKEKGIEEEAYFSCEICQKWMCEECVNNHVKEKKEHNYYIIRKVIKGENNSTCYRHNKEYKYYVTDGFAFGYHACESCQIRFHSDEDCYTINKQEGECYFNLLKEIIKEGVDYLDNYCKKLYESLSNSIKDDSDMSKKAKDEYDKFLIRNRRLLFYFQMVINTGTPSFMNYNLIQ